MAYCGDKLRVEAAGPDASGLVRQEHALAALPTRTAASWFELACVRAALAQWEGTGTLGHPPIMPRPRPLWHEGALAAALAAARDTPSHAARVLLASLILRGGAGRADPDRLPRNRSVTLGTFASGPSLGRFVNAPSIATVMHYARDALPLLQQAAREASPDTTLLRACTAIALDLDEFGVAHECAARALSRGYEPSWNLLRLAWFASRRADTSGARNLFNGAIASAGPRSARLAVAWHFKTAIDVYSYQIPGAVTRYSAVDQFPAAAAAKNDGSVWLELPQSQLLPWIERETGEGNQNGWHSLSDPAALVEHFARIAFAGELFRDCLPDEDAVVCKTSDWRRVHARRLRFWELDGTPVAVFTFMPVAHPTLDSLVTTIRQEDEQGRGRTDTVGALLTGAGGLVAVPSNDAWDSWTLDIDPQHPAQQVDFEDFQPSNGAPPLILSDLAVGSPTGAATWMHGGAAIPIAATSTFSHTTRLQLFYQVRCDTGCGGIEWSVRLRPVGHGTSVTLTTRAALRAGINDVTEGLDLTHVAAGSYRLEVEIRTDAARSVRRTTELIVKWQGQGPASRRRGDRYQGA